MTGMIHAVLSIFSSIYSIWILYKLSKNPTKMIKYYLFGMAIALITITAAIVDVVFIKK